MLQTLLFLSSLCSAYVVVQAASVLTLPPISAHPSNASQKLDPRLASLSIEFSYLPSFGGNLSNPNILTKRLLQQVEDRAGVGPDLRPGGETIDRSIYDPHSPALVLDENSAGGIWRTTYGPAYFESLAVFPKSTRIIVDTNLANNSVDIAQHEIQAAIEYIGWDRIYSIQLGNEPDQYPGNQRPSNWSSTDYTDQFLNWTTILTKRLGLPSHIFQAGTFSIDPTPTAPMTTVSTIEEGIDNTGTIKLFDQHTYQYSTCDPVRNAIATLPNLINHQNITAYLNLWIPQIAAAKSTGKEFVVGEFNSVSCSGKENVTNTFGQALWVADTMLYGAFLNISRMYLHQGATLVLQSSQQANAPGFSWYDLWYPVETDRYGDPRASPSYVSYLLISEAVGSSQASQLSLIDVPEHPQLAVYAIWDPAARQGNIARLAILNLAVRNVTTTADEATALSVTIDLTSYEQKGHESQARVKRMTSPGLDSTDSSTVTWANQSYVDGNPSGDELIETLQSGKVTLGGSEGVLVFF